MSKSDVDIYDVNIVEAGIHAYQQGHTRFDIPHKKRTLLGTLTLEYRAWMQGYIAANNIARLPSYILVRED